MPASTPDQIHPLFQEAFNARDVDRLMEFYTDDCAVIVQPGQVSRGQVQAAIEAFLALNGQLAMDSKVIVTVGDVAFLSCTWSIAGSGPDGQPMTVGGTTAEVAQRQSDGSWRYVIDNPWGDLAAGVPTLM
ncbi:YybH family protein [Trujillonella humicola]|uniref:YybH family protein n=1 Tax=Trujillonella humicola TaxID=3383699 RepID=UPI0039062778